MARCYHCMKEYQEEGNFCPFCGYDRHAKAHDLYYMTPGTTLSDGRYMIGESVNAGGFGIVYKAWDNTLSKLVAIKEYYPGSIVTRTPGTMEVRSYSEKNIGEFERGKARFLNEARKMARFNSHPNIVDVYDFFEEKNTAYMVMEFMDGMTYKEYIVKQGGKVSQALAVGVAQAVLDALREVHKEKIIHRDINPNNIFICSSGVVKLFDFGAARFEATEMSTVLTPHYAPPEQYSTSGQQGPQTDIYAVGATTYFALTGIKPEESTDRVQKDHVVPPHKADPQISRSLSNAVMRAMALKLELRFQNADQFLAALAGKKKVLDVEQELRRRRRVRMVQIAATFAVLSGVGGFFFFRYKQQEAAVTLQNADLRIWVMADGNDTPEEAKTRMEEMTAGFLEVYPQVTVNIEAFDKVSYETKLREAAGAGTLPDLFESTCLTSEYMEKLESLDTVLTMAGDLEQYWFMDQYDSLFPGRKQIPLCFQIPVIYVRTSAEGVEDKCSVRPEDFLIYSGLMGEECIEEYRQLSEEEGMDPYEDACRMFQDGLVGKYLSDTEDYKQLTEAMPAQFQVELPEGEIRVRFDHLWSVSAASGKYEKKAAQWLLNYMLSGNAQSILGVRELEGVPVNKEMCQVFTDVYQTDLAAAAGQIGEAAAGGSQWLSENLQYMEQWK